MTSESYPGRPGVSPVVAALFAAGVIQRHHRILDVGCGRGTDVVGLARWGVKYIAGLDLKRRDLRQAEAKAARHRVTARTDFHLGSITDQHECFDRGEFDIVIDSLCWNNLDAADTLPYLRELHRVLATGGALVVQARWSARAIGSVPRLPHAFARFFEFGPRVVTHLPERGWHPDVQRWATVVVCVGRRRRRPLRA